MNVSVVTVTYGDRIDYMRKMIDSIESQSVGVSVVVVDNASVNGVELEKLVGGSAFSSTVLRNEENLGSAMGYKIGIEYAYNHGADYIYLLDDDNCLDKHAIDFLVEAYLRLDDDTIIYSSLRYNRKKYRDLVSGNVDNVVRKSNKFIGFGIDFFCNNGSDDKGGIEYLTYGGLMLPSSVVKVVGYPDVDYFLYQDDRDYTYRMTLSGFHLKILDSSIVFDLEDSWDSSEQCSVLDKYLPSVLRSSVSDLKVYYSIRNRIIFDARYSVTARLLYLFNVFTTVFVLSVLFPLSVVLSYYPKRYRVIIKSIKDGMSYFT